MPAYQFFNPAPVFTDLLGLQPAANGSLSFYDIGTTTPRNTWSDAGLTTLNANPVPLGADGRSATPIFCDGQYTVTCRDSLGAVIWTRNLIPGGSSGATIPTLQVDQFLSNDGTNLLWQQIRQLPDPTGMTNHYVTTDGANWILQPIPGAPVVPDPDVVVTDTSTPSFRAGISTDPTKFLMQFGSGSAPSTGTKTTSSNITFTTAYAKLLHVDVMPTISAATPSGALVATSVTGFTFNSASSGVTANFNVPDDDSNASWKISNAITYTWVAYGFVEVTP